MLLSPDSGSALENLCDRWMCFEHLEGLERINVRVFVVQADNDANCNKSYFLSYVCTSTQLKIFLVEISSVVPH